jgi:hypothetical protein
MSYLRSEFVSSKTLFYFKNRVLSRSAGQAYFLFNYFWGPLSLDLIKKICQFDLFFILKIHLCGIRT